MTVGRIKQNGVQQEYSRKQESKQRYDPAKERNKQGAGTVLISRRGRQEEED
jgi:hypothetical protein